MKLKSLLKNIIYKLGLIADFIVEAGDTGNFYYEKYKSGLIKAYGYQTTNTAMTNAMNSTYYGNVTVDISELNLIDLFSFNVTGKASGAYFGTKIESIDYATGVITLSSRASSSATTTVTYMFNIIGAWK